MKTAIYIENNRMQFVLTAETQIDKKVIEQLKTAKGLKTFRGAFYDCNGGWIRQQDGFGRGFAGEYTQSDDSMIFLVEEPPAKSEEYEQGYQDGIYYVATGEVPPEK